MWAVAACVDSLRGALSKLDKALRLSLPVFIRSTGRRLLMCAPMREDRLCTGAYLTVSWVRVPAPVQGVQMRYRASKSLSASLDKARGETGETAYCYPKRRITTHL